MAVEIEFLKGLPQKTQIKLLNDLSVNKDSVPIQIDGNVFWIPNEVQNLIDNLSEFIEELGGTLNN